MWESDSMCMQSGEVRLWSPVSATFPWNVRGFFYRNAYTESSTQTCGWVVKSRFVFVSIVRVLFYSGIFSAQAGGERPRNKSLDARIQFYSLHPTWACICRWNVRGNRSKPTQTPREQANTEEKIQKRTQKIQRSKPVSFLLGLFPRCYLNSGCW